MIPAKLSWLANILYYTMVLIIMLISRTEIAFIHAYIHQACDDIALQVI